MECPREPSDVGEGAIQVQHHPVIDPIAVHEHDGYAGTPTNSVRSRIKSRLGGQCHSPMLYQRVQRRIWILLR